MNCIIIDDEPNAIDVLKRYVALAPFLHLIQTFRNPVKAAAFIAEENVDLVFLDINMPNLTGIQLVKSLGKKPLIIFTTAYSEHAVESYELNAADYLVKPIEFERFLKAVNKAREVYQLKNKQSAGVIKEETTLGENGYILLKSGAQIHKVKTDDILFIEKEENYLSFQTSEKKIMVRANMTDAFNYVPEQNFCRVHKSYVVSVKNITVWEVHQVTVGKYKIPVGHIYRDELKNRLGGLRQLNM